MKWVVVVVMAVVLTGIGCSRDEAISEGERLSDSDFLSSAADVIESSDTRIELWIVQQITADQIAYEPIDWFSGDRALAEAQKDGCGSECVPGGFYWRYRSEVQSPKYWPLDSRTDVRVELICNREDCVPDDPSADGFRYLSYDDYLSADRLCRATPADCPYYSIGTGMDFFQPSFADGGTLVGLRAWYVP
ncbi:MAG: hypothetical protein ABIJ46_00375 [bacterium]